MANRQSARESSAVASPEQAGHRHGAGEAERRGRGGDASQHLAAGQPRAPKLTRYAVVIEKARRNYSAYVPDLPGCIATGKTVEETRREIAEAIAFHIEGMRENGEVVPEPTSEVDYVEVTV